MTDRKIVIGLITSTEFLKKVRSDWEFELLKSSTARELANWCIKFYDKHGFAPGKKMQQLFFDKVDEGLDADIAEEIEQDILPELSNEFIEGEEYQKYTIKEAIEELQLRQIEKHADDINEIITEGKGDKKKLLKQALKKHDAFKLVYDTNNSTLDFSKESIFKKIKDAFEEKAEPLFKLPGAIGEYMNEHLIRGGFVSFLAPEKRGKTFLLIALCMMALKQKKRVAFFQAGDMTESEFIIRIGIYLCMTSNKEKYCEEHYEVVKDCIKQQTDVCTKKVRQSDYSPFEGYADIISDKFIKNITPDELKEAFELNTEYEPCYNCSEFYKKRLGVPWLKRIKAKEPIHYTEVIEKVKEFFHKYKRWFKVSTHPSDTLTLNDMDSIQQEWKDEEGFIAELVAIDYADLMHSSEKEERHRQNAIWKGLRKRSQTPIDDVYQLYITPTQADGNSYELDSITKQNYSEDKRKFAHTTAMFGINQTADGSEAELGLLRLNKIVMREGESLPHHEVVVISNLRQGRFIKGSYHINKFKNT